MRHTHLYKGTWEGYVCVKCGKPMSGKRLKPSMEIREGEKGEVRYSRRLI